MAVDRAGGYPGNESDGGLLPPISLSNSVVSRASDCTPMSNKRKMHKSESSSGTDSDYTSMSSGSPTKLPSLRGKSNSILSLTSVPRLCRTPSCPNLFEGEDYIRSPPPRSRIPMKPKAKDDSSAKDVKLPSIFDKSPSYVMAQPSRGQTTPRTLPSQQSNRFTPSAIVGESRQWYDQKHERTFYEKQDYSSPTAYTPNPAPTPALLFPISTSKEMEAHNRKKAKREKKKRRQTTGVQYHDLAEIKPKQVGDTAFEVKEIQKDNKQISTENKENNIRTQQEAGNVRGAVVVYAEGTGGKKDTTVVDVESELSISQSEQKCREWLTGLDPGAPTTAEMREKVVTTS